MPWKWQHPERRIMNSVDDTIYLNTIYSKLVNNAS